ncbi:hypothetical protein ACT4_025_00960 [Acinetobacter sp. NBRC 100985]|nr:hypothetical protein ACT4_025_00960 [Acinetobacter sp. NBRC 100985]
MDIIHLCIKRKNTPIQAMSAPIQVEFLTHPNEIKANQAVKIKVSKDNQVLANANVVIRSKGATDEQSKNLKTLADGTAELIFPKATEYLVEVSETVDSMKKPSNQLYTIISLSVN